MSSTNRGTTRNKDDLYETAHWLAEAIVPAVQDRLSHIEQPVIWEPCAGNGRITRVLAHHLPHAEIIRSDLNYYTGNTFTMDFLSPHCRLPGVNLVITNPAFSIAKEIISKAQDVVVPGGSVFALERLNFLGSRHRSEWLREWTPSLHFSPRRASFVPNGKTDSIEYGWFEWTDDSANLTYLDTLSCDLCDEPFTSICRQCDYGHCDAHKEQHECKMFGVQTLWSPPVEDAVATWRRRYS